MRSALFQEWVSDFVEEAEQKVREEIASSLLHDGQNLEYVAKIVKFPVDKIKKLADDIKE